MYLITVFAKQTYALYFLFLKLCLILLIFIFGVNSAACFQNKMEKIKSFVISYYINFYIILHYSYMESLFILIS